jgi:hypothetical protein
MALMAIGPLRNTKGATMNATMNTSIAPQDLTAEPPFKAYREAYDQMESDRIVQFLRREHARIGILLQSEEAPYRRAMNDAADRITEEVLDQKNSVKLAGVHAVYYKPGVSRSWKSIAEELNASDDLIAKHTTLGNPRVQISIIDSDQNP